MENKSKIVNNNEKGITLVALIVTIIVLIILAGISMNLILGENGIIKQANRAKEETKQATIQEQRQLAMLEASMNFQNTNYTDKNGNTVIIPAGFAVTRIEGENTIDEGLVIIDSNGNEYVWIEVPKNIEIYSKSGISITDFTNEEYKKIEEDLHTYTKTYRNETTYNDNYYSDETLGLTSSQYEELKKKMLKSIYQKGGFFIGRYEAGIDTNRTAHTAVANNIVPESKANLYPFTYLHFKEAQELANRVISSDYKSSLMFGLQWDLTLKFIEEKEIKKGIEKELIQSQLNSDSSSWGNYYNSTFTIKRGKYAQLGNLGLEWNDYTINLTNCVVNSVKQTATSNINSIVLTTGGSDTNCKQNIYDLAGNVYEYTLEYSNDSTKPCVLRGGKYNVNSLAENANYRGPKSKAHYSSASGFRVTIY